MTRKQATLIHLFLTLLVLVGLFLVIRLIWYPGPLFRYEGAESPTLLLVVTALIVGPGLTLLLFKPGKKGLWFDLIVIPLLQAGAIAWGLMVLHGQRPGWVVFSVDRFYILPVVDAVGVESAPDLFERPSWVYAPRWEDENAVLEVLMGERPHSHVVTERFEPLGSHLQEIAKGAFDWSSVAGEDADRIAIFLREVSSDSGAPLLFPLHGRKIDGALAFDPASGTRLAALDLDLERR